jgi:hypothetical protein
MQALTVVGGYRCRRSRSIIICLHVIFYYFCLYKRGAGSQIDTSSIKTRINQSINQLIKINNLSLRIYPLRGLA